MKCDDIESSFFFLSNQAVFIGVFRRSFPGQRSPSPGIALRGQKEVTGQFFYHFFLFFLAGGQLISSQVMERKTCGVVVAPPSILGRWKEVAEVGLHCRSRLL